MAVVVVVEVTVVEVEAMVVTQEVEEVLVLVVTEKHLTMQDFHVLKQINTVGHMELAIILLLNVNVKLQVIKTQLPLTIVWEVQMPIAMTITNDGVSWVKLQM